MPIVNGIVRSRSGRILKSLLRKPKKRRRASTSAKPKPRKAAPKPKKKIARAVPKLPGEPGFGSVAVLEQVRIYRPASTLGNPIRVVLSFDIVQQLFKLRDGSAKNMLVPALMKWHRIRIVPLSEVDNPGVFVYLAPLTPSKMLKNDRRLYRKTGKQQWWFQAPARVLGVKPDIQSKVIDHLFIPKPRGMVLIFDTADLAQKERAPT